MLFLQIDMVGEMKEMGTREMWAVLQAVIEFALYYQRYELEQHSSLWCSVESRRPVGYVNKTSFIENILRFMLVKHFGWLRQHRSSIHFKDSCYFMS